MTVQRRTPSDEHPTEVFRQIWDAEPGDPDEYFGEAVSAEEPGRPGPRPPAAEAPAASRPAEADGGDDWDWGSDEPEVNQYRPQQPPAARREAPVYADEPGYLDDSDDRYLDEPDHSPYLDPPGRRSAAQPDPRGAHAEPADETPAPAHQADNYLTGPAHEADAYPAGPAHQADDYSAGPAHQADNYLTGPAHEADAYPAGPAHQADAYRAGHAKQADAYPAGPAHQENDHQADGYEDGPADHEDAYPAGPAHQADAHRDEPAYRDQPAYQDEAYPEPAGADDRPPAEAEYTTQVIDAIPDEPADAGPPPDSGGTGALPALPRPMRPGADSRGTGALPAQADSEGPGVRPGSRGASAFAAQGSGATGALPAQPRSRGTDSEGEPGPDETEDRPALPRRVPGRTTSGPASGSGEQEERRGDVFPAPLRLPDLPPSLRAPDPEPASGVAEQLFGSQSGRTEQAETVIFDRVSREAFGAGDRSADEDARADRPDEPADERGTGRHKRAERTKRSTSRAATTSAAVGGAGATGALATGAVAGAAVASGALGSRASTSGASSSGVPGSGVSSGGVSGSGSAGTGSADGGSSASDASGGGAASTGNSSGGGAASASNSSGGGAASASDTPGGGATSAGGRATSGPASASRASGSGSATSGPADAGTGSAGGQETDEAERERRAKAALTETAAHPGPLVTDDDQADTDRDPDQAETGSDGATARRAEGTAASFAAPPPTADLADPTTQLRLPDFAASEQTALIDAAVDPDGPPGAGPRRARSAARAEAKAAQETEIIPAAVDDPKPKNQARKGQANKKPKPEAAKSETPPARPPMALMLVLLLVAFAGAAGAYFCYSQGKAAQERNQAQNVAYVDPTATSEVKRQITRAVEAIYSYDYTRLDQTEQLALAYITGSYSEEFKEKFQPVRQHGVQQKAALASKVVEIGVRSVSAQNAELLVMVNQVGRSVASPQPLKATMRLSVTAQRADGQWKVAGVKTR